MLERRKGIEIDQSIQDPKDPEFSLLVPEKRSAIEAIKLLNRRVTPAEISATSGLPINQASFWLNKIAGETAGKLEVAADGTIFYSFSPNFTRAYLQRGFKKAALLAGQILFQALYWLIRISFGVALILSLLIIVVICVLMLLAALGDNGGGEVGDFFDLNFLGDLFRWDYSPSHSSYPNSIESERRNKYNAYVQEHSKGNFFLECFSFLFGDGAPNSNLQQIRWQQIARSIKENGGVVSTEQLAPFLDGDRSDSGMILSALAQFNGRPEVTRSGYIVYVFPDFLFESLSPVLPDMPKSNYLEEDPWKFSAFPVESQMKVLFLAGINFAGSWWLFKFIASVHMLHELALVIDVLLTYAVAFLAIPLVRSLALLVLNARIAERNNKRRKSWELVCQPRGDVFEEIEEAREVRRHEIEKLTADRTIIFSSDQDSIEQRFRPAAERKDD